MHQFFLRSLLRIQTIWSKINLKWTTSQNPIIFLNFRLIYLQIVLQITDGHFLPFDFWKFTIKQIDSNHKLLFILYLPQNRKRRLEVFQYLLKICHPSLENRLEKLSKKIIEYSLLMRKTIFIRLYIDPTNAINPFKGILVNELPRENEP